MSMGPQVRVGLGGALSLSRSGRAQIRCFRSRGWLSMTWFVVGATLVPVGLFRGGPKYDGQGGKVRVS